MASSSSSSKHRPRRTSRASPRAPKSPPRASMDIAQAQDQDTPRPRRKRVRRNTLTLSISPELPPGGVPRAQPSQPRFFLGPEPSPTVSTYLQGPESLGSSSYRASFTSPELVEPVLVGSINSSLGPVHGGSIDSPLGPVFEGSINSSLGSVLGSSINSSLGPCSTISEHIPLRPSSTDTVRGPTTERDPTPPLTPFPPWIDDSEEEWQARTWQDGRQGNRAAPKRQRESIRYGPFAVVELETRWLLSSILHGVVLALQFSIALAVFSALMSVAVWKKPDSDVQFWEWLWNFAEPSLIGVLILCSGTLVAHEVKILSAVALLYLQCAILVVTTAASLIMWARCIEEHSRAVKGVLMGCNVLMWGLALFGFVRAVVVWKIEAEIEEERGFGRARGAQALTYGTFVPWDEAGRDH